ncbi:ResB protein required for cytochrome C biosynthesis [Opitutaceae bacterium EW11]|nr:ResB protein required for cytochrome C biosynthesis [Opitutaceae bacterium EW11]
MREIGKSFVQFFVSLKLTVVLLAISVLLVFFATLDQTNLGIWGIQHKWFQSFIVLQDVKGIPVPIFPGGYFVGGLLFFNLIAAHIYRFKFTWKKAGLLLTHFGLIILLVGELLSGLWQEEYHMRLDNGETKNYSESPHFDELAIVNASDPEWDDVVAIPAQLLKRGKTLQHPKLPFRVVVKDFYPNAQLQMRNQVPNAAPSPATAGFGPEIVATPLPVTYRQDERNLSTAYVELVGPQGSLGTWLVSTNIEQPQSFDYEGKTWRLVLRPERLYTHFTVQLVKFSHDRYAGTEIPKNFSSKVRLKTDDGHTDREVLIYMNNPLRFQGLTFYQSGFENNDRTSILQVVRNPSWLLPYVACLILFVGLTLHFGISLVAFASKRSRSLAVA